MQDVELVRTISRWQKQVWEKIYLHQQDSAHQALDSAWAEWHKILATPDVRRALEIYLCLLDYDCSAAFATNLAAKQAMVQQSLVRVMPGEKTRLASSCRCRVVLILRCAAHLNGARQLRVDEVRQALSELPHDTLGHQTCMYLALWAYSARSSEYLRFVYRMFSVNPYDFMMEFSLRRVRVMLALVEGNCEEKDVKLLIDCLPHPMHSSWFEETIKPELLLIGLWNAELDQDLAAKRAVLDAERDRTPAPSPRRELLEFM